MSHPLSDGALALSAGAQSLSAGGAHACAILNDGTLLVLGTQRAAPSCYRGAGGSVAACGAAVGDGNGVVAPISSTNPAYEGPLVDSYLSGCALGCLAFSSLADCQAKCLETLSCGGCTHEGPSNGHGWQWELR